MNIEEFKLQASDFRFLGEGLSRPECIIAETDGTLWVSDNRSALIRIAVDGGQTRIGDIGGAPNGFALARDGSFVIANIDHGCLYRLQRDGRHEIMLDSLDGKPLGAVNYAGYDESDRLWVTVSTLTVPRSLAVESPIPDGYVMLIDDGGARKVADGLCFTNEARLDASGRFLYIAETALGRVSRQPLHPDGSLGARETFGPAALFPGSRIDGITFDVDGNLWITEITRNGLWLITPTGNAHPVFEDPSATTLLVPTSITFGGADLRTAYVGSLKADRLAVFNSPVAGAPLPHWRN